MSKMKNAVQKKPQARELARTYQAPLLALAVLAAVLGGDWWLVTRAQVSRVEKALLRLERGDAAGAMLELGATLRANPADSAARLGLARAYARLGWSEQAAREYELAGRKASETLRQSYQELSALCEKLGRREDSRRYARAAEAL